MCTLSKDVNLESKTKLGVYRKKSLAKEAAAYVEFKIATAKDLRGPRRNDYNQDAQKFYFSQALPKKYDWDELNNSGPDKWQALFNKEDRMSQQLFGLPLDVDITKLSDEAFQMYMEDLKSKKNKS